MNAWEENSLPKSHLGWFFLVLVEGKATKENISMFWFILPLSKNATYQGGKYICYTNFIKLTKALQRACNL